MSGRHLQIVVCGAGPAVDIEELIRVAQQRAWTTAVTATISALDFIDVAAVEELTGRTVRSAYQTSSTGRRTLMPVGAVIVAPATYNTINKLANGIADNYALTSTAELIGCDTPTVVVPFVNSALAARAPFRRSIASLRQAGVRVLSGADDHWEPHPPGTGDDRRTAFPWQPAFQLAEQMCGTDLHR